jgi:N-acetylmuramoyl-L-alanine amidase
VIHHTGDDTAAQALAVLRDRAREVSAHYLVERDGTIDQLVDERKRAWHAGASKWGGDADVNSASIGIELDNNGDEPFSDRQIVALLALLADIKARYGIPAANFVGHADVAPARKVDPSRWFPWRTLAAQGFGLWCDAPPSGPPPGFDPLLALQALGYDLSDPDAAARAFMLHYMPNEPASPVLDPAAQAMLTCLVAEARESR